MAESFEVNFLDGRASGPWVAESEYSLVCALKASRFQLGQASELDQAYGPGVYFLANEGKGRVYIGQTKVLRDRLRTHSSQIDWWKEMLWITTRENYRFGTDRRRYVESYMVDQAKDRQSLELENIQTQTQHLQISELDKGKIDKEIIAPMCDMLLPLMGFDFLLPSMQAASQLDGPEFEINPLNEGIQASAKLVAGKWVVQKGSQAREAWIGGKRVGRTVQGTYGKLYEDLRRQNILVLHEDGTHSIFTENYEFNSSSAAASVIYGRQSAGPRAWKVKGQDKTYLQWVEENAMKGKSSGNS